MQTLYAKHNETLTGRNKDSKKLENNTYLVRDGSDIAVKLHNTHVVTFHPDNTATLETGGWHTVTTKDRINSYLPMGLGVAQERGKWYLYTSAGRVPFYDGMRIDLGTGAVVGEIPTEQLENEDASNKRLEKLLRKYIDGITAETVLNAYNGQDGDCWYCKMQTQEGKTLGEAIGDTSHLWSHLEEGYVPFALIVNAYKAQRYGNWRFVLAMDIQPTQRRVHLPTIKDNLRKYFRSQLREGAMTGSGFKMMGARS